MSESSASSDRQTIEVFGAYEEDLAAEGVDLLVQISGSSLVTGRAVLSKAREVATLVESLRNVGVAENNIDVVSVRAEAKSGLLTKSASAFYELRIRCNDLEQLPVILTAVTGVKNITLERLEWRYPSDAATDGRLLAHAAAAARQKAVAIAGALGVTLGELLEARELARAERSDDFYDLGAPRAARTRSGEGLDFGMPLQQRKKVSRELRLVYGLGKG